MKKVAFFASGNGSNFQNIIETDIPCKIEILISDQPDAFVLERAKKVGIETFSFTAKNYPSKKDYEKEILEILKEKEIEFIILGGYMRILSEYFIDTFPGDIINIHPSLLPKYQGKSAIERAYDEKEEKIGVTVHYVDYGIDTGEIIMQEGFKVDYNKSLDEIEDDVHVLEHQLYPKAIRKVLKWKKEY